MPPQAISSKITSRDIIAECAHNNRQLSSGEWQELFELFTTVITDHLAAGGRVEIRGLASWHVKTMADKHTIIPSTGQPITISGNKRINTKISKKLTTKLI
ncbi:MAG: HU family DNA-binding protein [Pseudomonadota bacterium]